MNFNLSSVTRNINILKCFLQFYEIKFKVSLGADEAYYEESSEAEFVTNIETFPDTFGHSAYHHDRGEESTDQLQLTVPCRPGQTVLSGREDRHGVPHQGCGQGLCGAHTNHHHHSR